MLRRQRPPEAYNDVFHNVANSVGLAFDPNAVHFLVVLGDSIPHDTVQAATFPACPNTSVNDPAGHTATTINELKTNHVTLLMISFGSFLTCYQQLTAATGGTAVNNGAISRPTSSARSGRRPRTSTPSTSSSPANARPSGSRSIQPRRTAR